MRVKGGGCCSSRHCCRCSAGVGLQGGHVVQPLPARRRTTRTKKRPDAAAQSYSTTASIRTGISVTKSGRVTRDSVASARSPSATSPPCHTRSRSGSVMNRERKELLAGR
jgi:hypothetical protein